MDSITETTTISYSYDPLYRLTGASYSGTLTNTFAYTYDAVGNRQTLVVDGTTTSYGYDTANRLTSVNGQPYTWDNSGNLLSDGLTNYVYDQANRLKQVTQGANTYTFGYNGMGDRLSQTVGITTTRYVLDPSSGLTQVLADGANTYLYGNGRLAQYQTAMQYFGADGLGSVRQIFDASAHVVGTSRYDPYGNVMRQSGATSVFAFAGEQYHAATGLEYLRSRYYSSAQGRFFQQDQWPGDSLRPQSLNAYGYVGNNVITYADPSGRCYGQLEGIRKLPVEDSLCGYLDMSIAILNSPTATDNEKRLAGAYVGGYGISHAYLALGGVTIGAGLAEGGAGWGVSQLAPTAARISATAATKYPLLAKLATGAGGALVGANLLADTGLTAKALSGDEDAQVVLSTAYFASGYMPFQGLPAVWSYLSRMKFFQFGIPCIPSLEFGPSLTGRIVPPEFEPLSFIKPYVRFGNFEFGEGGLEQALSVGARSIESTTSMGKLEAQLLSEGKATLLGIKSIKGAGDLESLDNPVVQQALSKLNGISANPDRILENTWKQSPVYEYIKGDIGVVRDQTTGQVLTIFRRGEEEMRMLQDFVTYGTAKWLK